jgi:hypothetical protein
MTRNEQLFSGHRERLRLCPYSGNQQVLKDRGRELDYKGDILLYAIRKMSSFLDAGCQACCEAFEGRADVEFVEVDV